MNQPTRMDTRTSANTKDEKALTASNEVVVVKNTDVSNIDDVAERNFYDFYLNEHQNVICRRLHFAGSSFGLLGLATAIKTGRPAPLFKGIVAGYACAWVGHFFFEKNRPATFKYPMQSFASDFRMYGDVLRGNLSLTDRKLDKIERKQLVNNTTNQ